MLVLNLSFKFTSILVKNSGLFNSSLQRKEKPAIPFFPPTTNNTFRIPFFSADEFHVSLLIQAKEACMFSVQKDI